MFFESLKLQSFSATTSLSWWVWWRR